MQNVARFGRFAWKALRTVVCVSIGWVSAHLSPARRQQNRGMSKAERKQLRKQQVREALAQRRPGRKGFANAA